MTPVKYKDIEEATKGQTQKVVFVLPTLMAGGAERVLITLMNGLDRNRFTPSFIAMDEKGTLRDWIAKDIPFHSMGHTKISRGIPRLVAKLNALEPDIIVSTMAAMNYGVLLAKPFLKNNPRIIIREAVIPSSIAEAQFAPWMVRSAYRNLYPQADMVLAPARCVIDEMKTYLHMPDLNYGLLHNPVDVARIRAKQKIQPRVTKKREQTVQFVCSGRLHVQKGFDRLIEALAHMRTPMKWELKILGSGPEDANLDYLIRKNGLQKKIKMLGLVKEPWPHYGEADAFLLPSRWEGLPNVALESLACGTPVISMAEAGGIAEIAALTDPGAVTIAPDMNAFVRAMERVTPDPSRRFAPSLLPEYFQLEAVVERFSDMLDGSAIPMLAPSMPAREKRKSFGRRSRKKAA